MLLRFSQSYPPALNFPGTVLTLFPSLSLSLEFLSLEIFREAHSYFFINRTPSFFSLRAPNFDKKKKDFK